jgi:MYXO-CTERM domain-containing protein
MFDPGNPIPWLMGLLVLAAVFVLLRRHFSVEARERRRRDRSHAPVISRKRGPTVKLAVDVGKPKRKRKR